MARRKRTAWALLVVIVVLTPILLPLMLLGLLMHLFSTIITYLLVWIFWLTRGRDILFVYSDSTIWREYMTNQILPQIKKRTVVLNWSERNQWSWWSLRARVFRVIGGNREFNPMVVLFRPLRRAQTFRFLHPFEDWKHGYKEPVERLTREMFSALGIPQNDHSV